MNQRYAMNEPSVVSETIDGEAVIVHLQSGQYFSARGTGSLVWEWLGRGATPETIARALAARCSVDTTVTQAAVGSFLADLRTHNLIRESSETAAAGFDPAAAAASDAAEWVAPTLDVYSDMQDLLLLDPIHDVDEAGWPLPKQPDLPAA